MARRLVEAGVRLVQVNWSRESDESTGSPMWDTHSNNAQRLRDVLCPRFDQAYSALLDDLAERGLLEETLVVVMSEFGRSPRINSAGGRDHWGNVFSVALAGAGIDGQVIGASDKLGGEPADRPVRPPELAATIFHLLGIDPRREFLDPLQRPRAVTNGGIPLVEVVGA
jgi:arylsulfatase A-like enzyme